MWSGIQINPNPQLITLDHLELGMSEGGVCTASVFKTSSLEVWSE